MLFDPVLYINLDHATERRQNVEREITRVFPHAHVERMIGAPEECPSGAP